MDKLQLFFYQLLRDKLPSGEVAELVGKSETIPEGGIIYSNKHIADYALELAKRFK